MGVPKIRASHCNSEQMPFGSTQLAPCVCFGGCAIRQARIRPTMDAGWLCRRNWETALAFVRTGGRRSKSAPSKTWQQSVRHVRHVGFFVVESVVGHMKKLLLEFTVLSNPLGNSGFKETLPDRQDYQRPNAPWRERFACKCTASEAQYAQHGFKNELRNMRW